MKRPELRLVLGPKGEARTPKAKGQRRATSAAAHRHGRLWRGEWCVIRYEQRAGAALAWSCIAAAHPAVLTLPLADMGDRDGGDIFGTKSKPGVHRGRYWDDRLQCWTDKPSPAIQRLMYSEATMPGDVADLDSTGMAEGQSIWNRMAAIIRARSLDVRILMDAHDRRNYGFVDIPTFRRSLCYAFGNQWIDLAMTSEELKEICAPYLTRKPNAKGEPEAFVMWQKFTTDLQALADKKRPTNDFLARLAEVEAREKASAALVAEYGVTEFELKSCLMAIKARAALGGPSSARARPTRPGRVHSHERGADRQWQCRRRRRRRVDGGVVGRVAGAVATGARVHPADGQPGGRLVRTVLSHRGWPGAPLARYGVDAGRARARRRACEAVAGAARSIACGA